MRLENPRLFHISSIYPANDWAGAPGSHGDRMVQPMDQTFDHFTITLEPLKVLRLKLNIIFKNTNEWNNKMAFLVTVIKA